MGKPTRVMTAQDPAYAGQRHYTPLFLRIYDPLVLGFFGRVVWRCPTDRLVEHYARHIGRRHLDVGPGTGYFLQRARLPADAEVTLLDPNPNVLRHAARRLAEREPSVIESDVLVPLGGDWRFDSAALNFVLHCLPGPMSRKAAAVRNIADVLEPDGVLFGATVLGAPEVQTWLSRVALRQNNRQEIFDNLSDTEDGLRTILRAAFEDVQIEVCGAVAVFSATKPKHQASSLVGRGRGARPEDIARENGIEEDERGDEDDRAKGEGDEEGSDGG
jgi:ubiquinone/menaquinone biosynthesis C-methylase UbiE